MNNTTRYQTRQAAYAEALQKLETWAAPRAMAHITNARTIIGKRNRGRKEADLIIPKGYEWASPYARGHKIAGYGENSIKIQYVTGSWNKPEVHTFEMPISDLSLSTWDYNKRVREAFKAAKQAKTMEMQRSYADKIAQAAREAKEAEKKLEALRQERDRYKARQDAARARAEAKAAKKAAKREEATR